VWFELFRRKSYSNPEETMAGLARTDLTTSQKVTLSALAYVAKGRYGDITELAEDFQLSRPTIYATRAEAGAVLARHFEKEESRFREVEVTVDEAQLRRSIVALRCHGPNSIRAIENLLPILYPGVSVSYGKIQSICAEAELRAAQFNAEADLSQISVGALDEMFSQGDPVLAGVDLDTGYLFSLALRDSRTAEDWKQVLELGRRQGLSLDVVVKDAARGIAAAVDQVFPDAEQRDDCFHALFKMGTLLHQLEKKAYAAIAKEEEFRKRKKEVRRTGRGDRWTAHSGLANFSKKCNAALDLHDRFEQAVLQAEEAMQYVDIETAELRNADEMMQQIVAAGAKMIALADPRCREVGHYVQNRAAGLVLYMRELVDRLTALIPHHGEKEVRLACLIWRLFRDLKHHRWPWDRAADERLLVNAVARLRELAGDSFHDVLADTDALIQRRHRASSAIEGFNAALRPYLYVHKGVTPGFLELFRAYHNLKTRRWGRFKRTSAHQLLHGEPVQDWLTSLGFARSNALN
jgi:hypothetical protein